MKEPLWYPGLIFNLNPPIPSFKFAKSTLRFLHVTAHVDVAGTVSCVCLFDCIESDSRISTDVCVCYSSRRRALFKAKNALGTIAIFASSRDVGS